jgi:hypothetical protein
MRPGALIALALLFSACGQGLVDHSGVVTDVSGQPDAGDGGDGGDGGCPDDHGGRDAGLDAGCEDAGT